MVRELPRLSSGNRRLDEILHGGLPRDAINLVIGAPGAGKTILADQYIFHNATVDRPGIYYSTLSEPHEKLLRYGQSLTLFDTAAVGTRVFYEALGPDVRMRGLDAVIERVTEDIKTRQPGVLVIDSFRALASYAGEREFRTFLAELADCLTAFPVSSFWVGEYTYGDLADTPEFAVADSILSLSREDRGVREFRYFQVLKLRGSGFLSGQHGCRLTADGIDVFPRLADPGDLTAYDAQGACVPTGVPAIDALTDGGLLDASSTLVVGPPGVGKTLTGMQWAMAGAREGRPSLIATFQENPSQLERIMTSFGWSLDQEHVHLFYRSAVDLYIDEWMSSLLDQVEEHGIRRVLVDSIDDLEMVASDPTRFREFAYSFVQRCARAGVSVMFTVEQPDLFLTRRLTDHSFFHLADNVVLLQYVERGPDIGRALAVIKTRGVAHDSRVHEFHITEAGVVPGHPISFSGDVTDG